MPDLITPALLIIAVSNIGIILILSKLRSVLLLFADQSLDRLILHRLSEAAKRQRDTKQLIRDEHKKTRKETQEIKTRLTWSRKRELADARQEAND
jgi:hypothetical protein